MKLGGWTRLGLIATVLWVGTIAYLTVSEYRSTAPGANMTFVHFVPGTVVDEKAVIAVIVDKKGKETTGIVWDVPAVRWVAVLGFILVPLSFIWIVIPVASFLFRWVRAGFEKSSP